MKLVIYLICIYSIFINYSYSDEYNSNNMKGFWITPKKILTSEFVLKNGEQFTFEGDICVEKIKENNNSKCLKVENLTEKVKFKVFFPDQLHEVTSKVVFKQSKDKKSWHYTYRTEKLNSNDLNQFVLQVGSSDKKENEFNNVKAKIEKRISILKENKQKYEKDLQKWSAHLNVISSLIIKLEEILRKIDQRIDADEDILAEIRLPLQVETKIPSQFYYSSNFSGFKLILQSARGLYYKTESADFEMSVINLQNKDIRFPESEDSDDDKKIDKSFANDLQLKLKLDSLSILTTEKFSLRPGESKTFNFRLNNLDSLKLNKLTMNLFHFYSNKKNDYFFDLLGGIEYVLQVSPNLPPLGQNILPKAVLNCESTSVRKLKCNANGSSDQDGQIVKYTYVWDDGLVSEVSSSGDIEHTFSTGGNHSVKLIVTDDKAGEDSKFLNFIVKENTLPNADFSCTSSQLFKVDCVSLSSDLDAPNDSIVNYSWNYDGNIFAGNNLVNSSFIYVTGGSKTISLEVTDSFGGKSTISKVVNVLDNQSPVANLNCTANNMLVECNGLNSYDPELQSLNFEFNYGDGTIDSNSTGISSHAYQAPGLYQVSLKVTDIYGSSSIAYLNIQALLPPNKIPIANLNCTSDSPFMSTCNSQGSTDSDGAIIKYKYIYDDGSFEESYSTVSVIHKFQTAGNHNIILEVTDNDGGVGSINSNIIVKENTLPIADFTCEPNFLPQKIRCSSKSKELDLLDSIVNFRWVVDGVVIQEGISATLETGFTTPGQKQIELYIEDSFGGKGQLFKSFTIIDSEAPQIIFQYPNGKTFDINAPQSFYVDFSDNVFLDLNLVSIYLNNFKLPESSLTIDRVTNRVVVNLSKVSNLIVGTNIIRAEILDNSGNKTAAVVNYDFLDGLAPQITFTPSSNFHFTTQNGMIVANISNSDDVDWNSLSAKIDGEEISNLIYTREGNKIIFRVDSGELLADGANNFEISLKDASGNLTIANATYYFDRSSLSFDFIPESRSKLEVARENISIYLVDDINPINWNSIKVYYDGILIPDDKLTKNIIDKKIIVPIEVIDQEKSLKIEVTDFTGKIITGESFYRLKDNVPPIVLTEFPNGNIFSNTVSPEINFEIKDSSPIDYSKLKLSLNGIELLKNNYYLDTVLNKIFIRYDNSVKAIIGSNTSSITVEDIEGNKTELIYDFTVIDNKSPSITYSPQPGTSFYSNDLSLIATFSDLSEINWSTLKLAVNNVPVPLLYYHVNGNSVFINLNSDYSFELGANTVNVSVEDIWGNQLDSNVNYNLLEKRMGILSFVPDKNTHFKQTNTSIDVQFNYPDKIKRETLKIKINDLLISDTNINLNTNSVNISLAGIYSLVQGLNKVQVEFDELDGNHIVEVSPYFLDDIFPPILSLSPPSGTNLNDQNLNFDFSINDIGGINKDSLSFYLNGKQISVNNFVFNGNTGSGWIKLPQGISELKFSAKDKAGNLQTIKNTYNAGDNAGPTYEFSPIAWTEFTDSFSKTVKINIKDSAGIDINSIILKLNGVQIPSSKFNYDSVLSTVSFNFDNEIFLKGGNNILSIESKDAIGHKSTQNITYKYIDVLGPAVSFLPVGGFEFVNNDKPQIVIQASDKSVIDFSKTEIKLNDQILMPNNYTFEYVQNKVIINLLDQSLKLGENKLAIRIFDQFANSTSQEVFYFLKDTLPPTSIFFPGAGTVFKSLDQAIKISLSDMSEINWNTLSVFLNDNQIASQNYIYNGKELSVIFSEDNQFREGNNVLKIKVSDLSGNEIVTSNNYFVEDIFPALFVFTPVSGSTLLDSSTLQIQIQDTSDIDWSSFKISLNGFELPVGQYAISNNNVSLNLSGNYKFKKGLNYLKLSVKDTKGNLSSSTASFNYSPQSIDSILPTISFSQSNLALTSQPDQIAITVFDESGIDYSKIKIYLNNIEVNSNAIQLDILNNKIYLNKSNDFNFKADRNLLTVFVADLFGNLSGKSVYFDLMASLPADNIPPVITFSPAGGEINTSTPVISAFISDTGKLDYSSLEILFNNNPIDMSIVSINQETGKVDLVFNTNYSLAGNDSNVITIKIKDDKNNLGTASVGLDKKRDSVYSIISLTGSITSLNRSMCAIIEGGYLRCWGYNSNGQLATGDTNNIGDNETPSSIPYIQVSEPVKQVSQGYMHTCSVAISGKLYCWGNNSFGQVGTGTLTGTLNGNFYSPQLINVGRNVTQVSSGYAHTCLLLDNGNIKCFGWNGYGILGQPTSGYIGDNETPSSIPEINLGKKALEVTTGWQFSCALLEDGAVKCWGLNNYGQLGQGNQNYNSVYPNSLPAIQLPAKAVQISSSYYNTCAVLDNGKIYCWGFNNKGQLGLGHTNNIGDDEKPLSTLGVDLPLPAMKVAVGGTHACALMNNLKIKCWGENNYNQLGYGNNTNNIGDNELVSAVGFVDVGGDVADIMAGDYVSYAILTNGTMKAWGENAYGQLGFGTTTKYFVSQTPSQLPSVSLGGNVQITGSTSPSGLAAYFDSAPYYGPAPLMINFDASKSLVGSSGGTISNYHWDFGDGTVQNTNLPQTDYTYLNNGVFKVTLTVSDSNTNTAIFYRTITVGANNNPPFAFFNSNTDYGIAPANINFDASLSFDVNGTIEKYIWDFGDGITSESVTKTITHTYSTSGVYLAMLTVQDNLGAQANAFPVPVTIKEFNMEPFASFDCTPSKLSVNCNAFSSGDLDGQIVNYKWEFGDGAIVSSSQSYIADHVYQVDGIYHVKLTITDSNGALSSFEKDILIDTIAPTIFANVADGTITNDPNFSIELFVDDASTTQTTVLVNGMSVFETTDNIISVNRNFIEGINSVEVLSVDSAGNKTSKTIFNSLILDTVPPQIAAITPTEGSEISTTTMKLKGSFNERISALSINSNPVTILADGRSFEYVENAYTEGIHNFNFEATDLAGNLTLYSTYLKVQLKILYPELISITHTASGELNIIGAVGATKGNSSVVISSGILNRTSFTSNPDGSFETKLKYFTSAKVTVSDSISNRTESAQINYNVDTTLAGVIKDTDGNPLPGVKILIKDTDVVPAVTNSAGMFTFSNPPTGDRQLIVDAQGVPVEAVGPNKKFSTLEISVSIGSRQSNVITEPIYLAPLLYDGTETVVEAGVSTTVESPNAGGVAIDIPGNVQVNFPEGNTLNAINVIEVNKNKTTVPVPTHVEPQSVIALEPSGLSFSEPVDLTLPNTNEFPSGMQLMIYSKNSKTGQWEVDGLARVDDTGTKIITEPGNGITHFSEVYAAPMGLKYAQMNSQDKPGVDTFNGAVSSSISFPGYKVLGEEISPRLIYRSNWAYPTATITNVFTLPTEMQFINADGQRIPRPIDDFTRQTSLTTWAIPEKVDVNYVIGDYHSPMMSLTGIPSNAVVSIGVDLKNQNSGVLPFVSNYEIHLKRMIVRSSYYDGTTNGFNMINALSVLSGNDSNVLKFNDVIPSSLNGHLFVQNKSNSKVGKGWMVGGVQKIVNPNNSRLMIEEDDGSVSSYVVDDKIQTLHKTSNKLVSLSMGLNSELNFTDMTDKLSQIDLSTNIKSDLLDAPTFSGVFNSSSFYTRHECTTWGTFLGKGRVCISWDDRFYCRQSKANYNLNPVKKFVIESPNGDGQIVANEKGLITLHSGNSYQILAGGLKNAPTSDSSPFFCAGEASCSGKTTISDFRNYPPCPPTPAGSGFVYDESFNDGSLLDARFNKIKSIAKNPTANGIAIADYGNHRVRYLNLDTKTVTTIAGNGKTDDTGDGGIATESSIFHPQGLVYDNDGNLYVSSENGYIRKIDRSGRISKIAGNPSGAYFEHAFAANLYLNRPYGLAIDNDNKWLYVAVTGNNVIVKIDLATGIAKNVAGNGFCKVEPQSGEAGSALSASLCNPEFVELDENKNLVIADNGHNLIRRVIFSNSAGGVLNYDSVAQDSSKLIRNADLSFTRTLRSGVKINFDKFGKHISTVSRTGRSVINNYDTNGELISQVDPLGGIVNYEYSFISGNLSKISYSTDGREFLFDHDINKNLTSVTYPDGTTKQFGYNSNGLLTTETDQRSNSITYTYNDWKRLQEITRPDGKKVTINDSQSVSMINNFTSGIKGQFKTQGTNPGQLADGIKDAKGITTTFVQDESGYVSTIVDGEGKITKVERDLKGRPTKIIRSDDSFVDFVYDQNTGDLLSKSDSSTGTTETFEYDSYGNLLAKTDGLGRKILNMYNAVGLLTKTTNEILGTSTTYTYNPLGQLASQTDSLGNTSSLVYNTKGNVEKAISADGKETNYLYYPTGLVQKVIDSNLTETKYEYDVMNRLLAVTTGGNQKTQYSYQETGELTQTIDPYNKITNFYYDNLGQLIKKVGTRGEITQLSYDENGNLSQEITPKGDNKYFYYDNLNQLIRKLLPDDDYNFTYDVRGNVTSVRNLLTKIDLSYQHFDGGDVVSETHSYGIGNATDLPNTILSYGYNNLGERISMNTPQGTFSYSRDSAGRLKSIVNHKGEIFNIKYDLNQRLKEISTPATITNFSFDQSGFNTQIQHTRKSGAVIDKVIYGRDEVGNRISKTTNNGTTTYEYDKNYQLIKSTNPVLPLENFTYDSLGNRISDVNSTYTYDESKQLVQEDYRYLYSFDSNGNMTSKQEKGFTGNVENFDYDSENQLRQFKLYKNGLLSKEVVYSYDAFGRRVEKTVLDHEDNSKSFTKRFAYDGSELLFELNEVNSITKTYTHSTLRTDDVLAVSTISGSNYFLKDGLGSITDVTDVDGFKIQHYEYSSFGVIEKIQDGFGNDVTLNPNFETHYAFTGREYDEETGLYYYRARYYDPNIGRFLQADPAAGKLLNPITHINKYIYGGNNPINMIDPSGRSFWGEVGDFFGGKGGWRTDVLTAIAVVGVIYLTGGVGAGPLLAVASAAGGAALAAATLAVFQSGNFFENFSENFHTNFRISATMLALGAGAGKLKGGKVKAGGNGYNGWVSSTKPVGPSGGVTIGSSTFFSGSSPSSIADDGLGTALGIHEAGHTIQFIGLSGLMGYGGSDNREVWTTYLGLGVLGTTPFGEFWEKGASALGGAF